MNIVKIINPEDQILVGDVVKFKIDIRGISINYKVVELNDFEALLKENNWLKDDPCVGKWVPVSSIEKSR